MTSSSESPAGGLRERKKARTRMTIRSEGIRLFAEQGFAATTVEQIAEASDISPSTFFRYFPTKEALAITDEYDEQIFAAFVAQPPEVPAVRAFRNAVIEAMGSISQAGMREQEVRYRLLRSEPALRSAMLDQLAEGVHQLADLLAPRMGVARGDTRARTLAGAIVGVSLSIAVSPPGEDLDVWSYAEMQQELTSALAVLEALESGPAGRAGEGRER